MKHKDIYLVATYFKKPKDHVNTTKAGWMDDPENIRWDEKVEISRGLKNKDTQAHVLINLNTKTVERNSFNDNRDFDKIFRYYWTNYDRYMTQVMGQLDPGYLQKLIEEVSAELEAEGQAVDTAAEVVDEEASAK